MPSTASAVLQELERDRKKAQSTLYQRFLSSDMTPVQYNYKSSAIDYRFAREEAIVILQAIANRKTAK